MNRAFALLLLILLSRCAAGWADVAVPGILEPKNPAEAWNVIRLATKNVDTLLGEKRLSEIAVQISYCSPALRLLARFPDDGTRVRETEEKTARAFHSINAIARAAQENNAEGVANALASLRSTLEEIARYFDPKTVQAEVYFCPMHADFVSIQSGAPCAKCGMHLLPRRIPYSFIYTKPGQPSIHMTASVSGPIEAERRVQVKVRLQKADQSPVRYADLLNMHTEYIHLLIEEPGLGDYHHEHPKATDTDGEYEFAFTPAKTAPYRIWADLVPAATGIQELPFVDLPSKGTSGSVKDTEPRFESTVDGYRFALLLAGGNHLPVQAGQVRRMNITVTEVDGKPVTILAPVMNAFAHLVGFYGDFQTVVHLHPGGGEILDPALRGGPSLGFMFFPPEAGFMRLYCQVLIDGKMLFAPFNLEIAP